MKLCVRCQAPIESEDWHCSDCGFEPVKLGGMVAFAPELASSNDGFRPERFAELYRLEARHFWFRSRNRLIVWALRRYFPAAASICEVGCGTGFVLSAIRQAVPNARITGTEIHTEGLRHAAERNPGVQLLQMDARRFPFRQEFDVIGAFDVLEHIEEDRAVIAEMHKALKPGGGLLITVPQHPWLWSAADEMASHKRRYTAAELRAKVEQAGFAVCTLTSFVSLLLPLVILSRKPRAEGTFDPLSEFRIPRVLNWAMEQVLGLELGLIRIGARFPAGSSLLLAARKLS